MPRFSVVIPVYNRARTVLPTLESVRNQTFQDFECIVVDDGSADGEELRAVVERFGDTRFRYIRRENGGASAARNTGIDGATGEYIAFLDSDDDWLPQKLSRDSEVCSPERVVFSPVLIETGGRIVGKKPKSAPRAGEPIPEYLACRGGWVPASSVSVPAVMCRIVRWNESLTFGDDTDFAIRLATQEADFHMLPDALSVVHDNEAVGRLSRSTDWRRVLDWLEVSRGSMGERAYLGYRGWHVARLAAQAGEYQPAFRYYLRALSAGALSTSVAAKAFAQIVIPRSAYTRVKRSVATTRAPESAIR